MKFSLIIRLMFVFCCFSLISFAQKIETQEKPKSREQIELEDKTYKLLTEISDEAASLKLGENRAFVYVIVGNLLWEKDEKAARRYFANAVSELIEVQNNPKKRFQFGNEDLNYWSYVHNVLRGQIVYSILSKDPQTAFEVFNTTRPAEIENAVQMYRQIAAQSGKTPDLSNYKQEERNKLDRANLEIQQEQNLKKEIAKNDPKKMADYIRESIAGGTNYHDILPELDNLNKKDHDAAQKLLDEFIEKLSDEDSFGRAKSYLAYVLYNRFSAAQKTSANKTADGKNKELEFDGKKIKAIAVREFDKLSTLNPSEFDYNFVEYAMYLKKILPERFAEIKPKMEKVKAMKEWVDDLITSDELGDDPTITKVIENSRQLSPNTRNNYYSRIIEKLSKTETPEKIALIIEKILDEKDREKALDFLNSLSAKDTKNDNLNAVKSAALQIKNEKERIIALVNLATVYHQKNTDESRKIAVEIMNEAGRFTNQTPESETEFEKYLLILDGYAAITPEKTFDLLPPIIEKSNELINAYVIMANYNDKNYPYVSENEIIFPAQDSYSSYRNKYSEIVRKMAKSDFDRTNNLIKISQRSDVRIAAKLILAQSLLAK